MRGDLIIGVAVGFCATLVAVWLLPAEGAELKSSASTWIQLNLGHSIWLFALVLILFGWQLHRLQALLKHTPDPRRQLHTDNVLLDARVDEIARLEQLLDVWIQSFVGIGVIWTAVGMRSALQAALSDPSSALTDTAGNVLKDLVDGGILLALSTTIVGAVGGYLMRLLKTALIGAQLQAFYAALENQQVLALREATERIEAHLRQQPLPNGVSP
ncbi:MAG: hypothetical protein AAF529_08385 [Pseudomonadota bacterium]